VLYLLDASQHEHLDRTEGVGMGLYRRVTVEIDVAGVAVEAETYVSEIRDETRRPSHRYRGLLIEGAREHGLPQSYVEALERWPLAWDEREGAVNSGSTPIGGES
jgi:gamma-glutamylcyclotransferase